MSKASQEAKDLRQAEAAQVQESDIRELAPESGTPEATAAEDARAQIKAVAEVKDRPSFEEAMADINSVRQGDNQAADTLSHRYGSKLMQYVKRIPTALDGEAGWHCEGREDGPLTAEQSQELADAFNSKIDLEKMKEDAAKNKARNERKKAKKQASQAKKATKEDPADVKEAELSKADLIAPAIQKVKNFEGDYEAFEKFVYQVLHRGGLLIKNTLRNYRVSPVDGLEGSQELCDTVIAKKQELRKKQEELERAQAQKEREQKRLRVTMKELLK